MDVMLTEQQRLWREQVAAFARQHVLPEVEAMEQGQFPRTLIAKMGKQGFLGLPIPAVYQGLEADFTTYIIAIHELSKVSATIGVIVSVHTSVVTMPILAFGTTEQKESYVPLLASGQKLGAFCLTEPTAGSDASSIQLRAEQVDEHYILNGTKIFITSGGEAELYLVFAVTDPASAKKNISAFIVEKDTPGFTIGKDEKKMGLHGSKTVTLHFDGVRIPKEQLLGAEGEGFRMAMSSLNAGRIGIAAQSLGIAEAALTEAVTYLKQHPAGLETTIRLGDLAAKLEAAKLLVYQAAAYKEANRPVTKEASMAKLFASRTAVEISTEVIHLLGMDGYTNRYHAERYFRDAKICEIYEGTSEIQRLVICKQLI
ncbi:acyl-CoA dehydrogenase family protein [Bacillus sp. 28A-2]|uniref:acyl-CoA dehydrogenase family protein n=1 Tax=Bacillus sp. 28A-2 TaxID=2772252 RepID=UPI00168D5260|nr:acyl-CoA dehydrogenase family protein [Bacillus sp. 28A-2]MBD3859099.1 acyl-CoA dehydrogenase family protein [Bacillus sp. 28A-2]